MPDDIDRPIAIVPADVPHYAGLHRALDIVARERRYLALTEAPPWEQALAFYRGLRERDFPHMVALVDGDVAGWCDIAPVFGQARAHIGVLGIGVVPALRHRGLGRRLMQAAIAKAWSRGLTRIELTVRTDNPNARALYETLGFEFEGVRRHASLLDGQYHDLDGMALLRG